jgi:hypothetical protein
MDHFITNIQALLVILLATHAVAIAIVNLTPTPKDDETVAKVYKLIEILAGIITKLAKK